MNHTPGPWTATGRSVSDKHGETLFITNRAMSVAEAVANAQLIAVAPEMLAELRRLDAYLSKQVQALRKTGYAATESVERLQSVRALITNAESK